MFTDLHILNSGQKVLSKVSPTESKKEESTSFSTPMHSRPLLPNIRTHSYLLKFSDTDAAPKEVSNYTFCEWALFRHIPLFKDRVKERSR